MMPEAEPRLDQRFWKLVVDGLLYFGEVLLSTVGAMLCGILAMLITAGLTASVTRNMSGGDFVDHMVDQPLFNWFDRTGLLYIAAAAILGWFGNRRFRTRWGHWVWILPTIALAWNLLTWEGAGPPNSYVYWKDVWDNYFGTGCGGSECVYELFVTVPFYAPVAYSVAWSASSIWSKADR